MNPQEDIDYVEEELIAEIEENILPPDNIVVLNELRSASDLNRLMALDSIDIQPDFQRDEVWNSEARARFIDSLSKEFPIPSMCFALDPKEQKYIVIDGLQRMSTVKKFLGEPEWVLPKLKDIDKKLSGKKVSEIKKDNPEIYRRIENIPLPVTILRYDPKRSDNMEYIFTIFQRLNTFGERLNNQEMRNAIFHGGFNSFLKDCVTHPIWQHLTAVKKKGRSNRMIAEEKLLRFFAFHDAMKTYDGKLNKFLNEYMSRNREIFDREKKTELFKDVMNIVETIGAENVGPSNAVKDAILYGISKNIDGLKKLKAVELRNILKKLKEDDNFSVEALGGGTMKKDKVHERLSAAEKIFSRP